MFNAILNACGNNYLLLICMAVFMLACLVVVLNSLYITDLRRLAKPIDYKGMDKYVIKKRLSYLAKTHNDNVFNKRIDKGNDFNRLFTGNK